MSRWNEFLGPNAGYVAELYERYRDRPESLDETTRLALAQLGLPPGLSGELPDADVGAIVGAVNLAEAIRRYGHLAAQLDPLGTPPPGDPALEPETHGVEADELERLPATLIRGPLTVGPGTAADAIAALRKVYCSTVGYDYAHVFVPDERRWLRDAVETGRFRPPVAPVDAVALLERLSEVEAFEVFLHRTFPGKTRFSLEGLDMFVPMLDAIVSGARLDGLRHVLIGMAHRGRLNVLAHVLQKPYAQILAEFKDPVQQRGGFRADLGWTGDVKYHSGAHRTAEGGPAGVEIRLAANPSHLEFVDPVVAGMARAAGTDWSGAGLPRFDPDLSLPILVHGDAAFPGQGIVAETLNLSRLAGYSTGGTIHIILNNQLGFTATPEESYSTSYASGLARGFKIPIVHVNADDPVACLEAARLAWAYRARFHRDFLIDLVGYRRYGHNEGDEPAFTQPLLYEKIAAHPTVRSLWAVRLERDATLEANRADAVLTKYLDRMQKALDTLRPAEDLAEPLPPVPATGAASRVVTAVPLERLDTLNRALLTVPPGFTAHRKIARALGQRADIITSPDERTVDWAAAESLALGSLLEDGVPIRLSGEDVERGTFSHRHAVLWDVATGASHVPLQAIPGARATFEIWNSPLSENAALGFEYGYDLQAPDSLVIWEAQYGDFINGAQVIVDEFIVSGRAKWGDTPSLVLLLPHAHEGQGPDHSSARPERFLQTAADINLRLANCTTAAQYFHLLRRQAALLRTDPLPLIVLTPKSLLRHPLVASTPRELAEGRFEPVLDDRALAGRRDDVRRVLVCSGKVAVDLASADRRAGDRSVAIVRLEQLYPFPGHALENVLASYPGLEDLVWVQEEPENMGAWEFVRPLLEGLGRDRWKLQHVARRRASSPAEGSTAWHAENQRALLDRALGAHVAAGEPVEQH